MKPCPADAVGQGKRKRRFELSIMAELVLVRHGETEWDREGRLQGTLDIPLNNIGKGEAERISRELSVLKISGIYSSPVAASYSTACEVAMPHKLKVRKMGEFSELNHGIWQGLLLKVIKKRYKRQYSAWKSSPTSGHPPKGESLSDACDRAVRAVHKIIDKHGDGNICVVSHDVIISVLKCYFNNVDLDKIWEFVPGKARWEVIEV